MTSGAMVEKARVRVAEALRSDRGQYRAPGARQGELGARGLGSSS